VRLASPVGFPKHADEHRPECPVLLAVDQELGEGAALWVAPELSDPVGSLEVGEHEDVEEFGASGRRECFEASPERRLDLLEGYVLRVVVRADDGVKARCYASTS
jgi:hypothetical protein